MEQIKKLNLQDACPTMTYEVCVQEWATDERARPLIVQFVGRYREGVHGNTDGDFMKGVIDLVSAVWAHGSLAIDLSRLEYRCGDIIDFCLESPRNKPVAVVVGPGCDRALAELWFGETTTLRASAQDGVFDDLDEACAYLRMRTRTHLSGQCRPSAVASLHRNVSQFN
ncbi:hypothetical protein ISN76_19445 [Dyella halodurans]|uniref:STAS/SEC14 domain-containing protein n=1 Tax=Dyella halodurans TaxID=1920171 RepID=A0ABV9BZZ2_9GAMM|nr:hypothetical protein [Dyella halodurans]